VLDLHCGTQPQTFFQPRLHICCEPRGACVHVLQQRFAESPHVVVLPGEALHIARLLPDRSVDTIFLSDTLQVLTKAEGYALLKECARIARQQIILRCGPTIPGESLIGSPTDASARDASEFEEQWRVFRKTGDGSTFWAIRDLPVRATFSLPMKVAVLSTVFPPNDSGQAIILGRLFRDVNEKDYVLISSRPWRDSVFPNGLGLPGLPGLDGAFHHLSPEIKVQWPRTRWGSWCNLLKAGLLVGRRVRRLIRILKQERCRAIIGCSGALYDLPVAYLAGRWLRIPFHAYLFDYYRYQFDISISPTLDRMVARYMERIFLRAATGIIVPNAGLQAEYRRRYGVEAIVIHNHYDDAIEDTPPVNWPASPPDIRIVYTGQIYQAQFDALCNLIEALDRLRIPEITLHLYTAQLPEEICPGWICGPHVIFHPHVPSRQVVRIQRHADILFLPLAFHTPYPEIIDTSLPTKTGEYLASGRPVLVHAPPGAFVSRYCREHGCGVVVDEPDPGQVATAIEWLISDEELRARCVRNARECARTEFSLTSARERLVALLRASAPKGVDIL